MMDAHQTYFGNHTITYVKSNHYAIHTLNLHSAICQLYLNETGKPKVKKNYKLVYFKERNSKIMQLKTSFNYQIKFLI